MSFIDLDIDVDRLNQLQVDLQASEKQVRQATRRALNRTADHLASKASKKLGPELGVQARAIKKRFLKFRLVNRGGWFEVKLWFGFNPLDYADLNPKQDGSGIKAGLNRKLRVTSGFLAPVPDGSLKVFKREGPRRRMTGGRYKGRLRQPIKKQTKDISKEAGAWVEAGLFNDRELSDYFMRTFERDLEWLTQKRK